MGDFKKTHQTPNEVEERESRICSARGTVRKLTGPENCYKTQVISAKVAPEIWVTFKAINRARGMSNNSVINMLMTGYIRDNQVILEDDQVY